jgi:hypothetical protein
MVQDSCQKMGELGNMDSDCMTSGTAAAAAAAANQLAAAAAAAAQQLAQQRQQSSWQRPGKVRHVLA